MQMVLQARSPQQAISAPLALLDALSHPSDNTALAQTLLAAGSARCRAWPSLTSEQVRECVRAVVVKVTIGPGKIIIGLSKSAVRAWLLAGADNAFCEAEDDRIELERRGEPAAARARYSACGEPG